MFAPRLMIQDRPPSRGNGWKVSQLLRSRRLRTAIRGLRLLSGAGYSESEGWSDFVANISAARRINSRTVPKIRAYSFICSTK